MGRPLAPRPRKGLIVAHPNIPACADAHTEELMKKILIAGMTALALIGAQASLCSAAARARGGDAGASSLQRGG